MKTFEYKGFDHQGKPRRGLVEALSVKAARERLAREGILAERLSATGRRIHLTLSVRAMIYRELASLLNAGIPLVRGLEMLMQSPELSRCHFMLAGVRDQVREGTSLAVALSESSDSVSAFERAILAAAEESATVDSSLVRLAGFLEEQERLRDKVISALIYPALVVAMGLVVAVVMMVFLVPRAKAMLAQSGVPLPWLTKVMIALGQQGLIWIGGVLFIVSAGIFHVRHRRIRDVGFRERIDRMMFKLPVIGRGYAILAGLRFSRTLAVLIQGGVQLIEGMKLAGRASGSEWVASLSEREAMSVHNGGSLADAVRRIPPLSATLPGWIQVGEAGGTLQKLLEHAADRYQAEWDRYISRSMGLLEPVLILTVGGFVLLIAVSVLLPVLSLSRTLAH